jgi:ubiquinol-cytochrome c reductase cytochrome b subunit
MGAASLHRTDTRATPAVPPDRPVEVVSTTSWVYLLGVLSMGAFIVVLASGAVLALEGPTWWHRSGAGRFANGLHLWSTELFFLFMVVHLWAKYFTAAWRGRAGATWVTGAIAFLVSIPTAFTGYLAQQNLDAEWIAIEAKDGLNATGLGAFFNPLDFGQMLIWHVLLLPLAVVLLIWVHLRLVRRRGLAQPIPRERE